MRKLVFIFTIIVCFSFAKSTEPVATVNEKCSFITTDPLGNLYTIIENKLKKFDQKGKELYTYSNFNAGDISNVDAMNPMKVMVFYKDFAQIEILDNTLTINKSPIQLGDLGYQFVTLACASYNNGFWIYNPINYELIRFNENLKESNRSGNLSQTVKEIDPVYLTEYNNQVFLGDPEAGILVFDRYGAYLKTIPIKNSGRFQLADNTLFYSNTGSVSKMNLTSKEVTTVIRDSLLTGFRIENKRVYLQKKDKIEIFTF